MYPKLWSDEIEARVRAEARNLDPQIPPKEVVMCKRCVMTNQRPRIVFDEEGVCSACRHAERKANEIDWDARRDELESLLAQHRGKGAYDCVVPASGGKDSAFVAHKLKYEFGMNPLCARWAPHMITDIGERNWQSFIHSGFDTVTAQPNGLLHRKLSRLALEFYGDPFIPFIWGQLAWPMHVAAQNNIKLVFFGENGEAEYGGDPSANDKRCWDGGDWDRIYMKGAQIDALMEIGLGYGAIDGDEFHNSTPFYDFGLVEDMENWSYVVPQDQEFHWLGYYLKWEPQSNYYMAAENCGFEANPERSHGTYSKYASLDDKLDFLHYRLGFVKFGIGRTTSDAAHEIRDDELTRDEALSLVEKYDDEYPSTSPHWNEALNYLGIDADYYDDIEARFARLPNNSQT